MATLELFDSSFNSKRDRLLRQLYNEVCITRAWIAVVFLCIALLLLESLWTESREAELVMLHFIRERQRHAASDHLIVR